MFRHHHKLVKLKFLRIAIMKQSFHQKFRRLRVSKQRNPPPGNGSRKKHPLIIHF